MSNDTEKYLLLGGLGLAAIWAWNASKGIQTATQGIGYGMNRIGTGLGNAVYDTTSLYSDLLKNFSEANKYLRDTASNLFKQKPNVTQNFYTLSPQDKQVFFKDNKNIRDSFATNTTNSPTAIYTPQLSIIQAKATKISTTSSIIKDSSKVRNPLLVKTPNTNYTNSSYAAIVAKAKTLKK